MSISINEAQEEREMLSHLLTKYYVTQNNGIYTIHRNKSTNASLAESALVKSRIEQMKQSQSPKLYKCEEVILEKEKSKEQLLKSQIEEKEQELQKHKENVESKYQEDQKHMMLQEILIQNDELRKILEKKRKDLDNLQATSQTKDEEIKTLQEELDTLWAENEKLEDQLNQAHMKITVIVRDANFE